MLFEHDGERVSILVERRAHTQSVLAVVRMEPSGRTLAGLGFTFPSATVRALWRLSEAFRRQGRPPLSGEEEERVLSVVSGDTSIESLAASAISSPMVPGEGRDSTVVMEIEYGGVRVRMLDRVNHRYVAALVAALAGVRSTPNLHPQAGDGGPAAT